MNTFRITNTLAVCAVSAVVVLSGCKEQVEPPAPDAVARVAGRDIVFNAVEAVAVRRAYNIFSDQSERAYTETVNNELLAAEAEAAGYFQDPEVLSRIRSFAIKKLLQDKVDQALDERSASLSETELKAYYDKHKGRFSRPEMVRGQLLYLLKRQGTGASTFEQKQAAIPEALKRGEDFTQLVRQYSDSPAERSNGGFTGWILTGELSKRYPAEIIAALASAEAETQVMGPIETEQAIYFVKVAERRAALETPFEQVRQRIEQQLNQATRQERYEAYLVSLESKHEVERYTERYQELLKVAASQFSQGGPPRGPAGQ
jgi:peptidyl-prolyl cis-trans isomerase C